MSADLALDWDAASRWAGRLVPPGPAVPRAEAGAVVDALRVAADRAVPLALRASRLGRALDAAGTRDRRAQVLVVDRPGWVRAAAQSFAGLLPADLPTPGGPGRAGLAGPGRAGLAGAGATAQAAGVLGLLATRVLGQLDPFAPVVGGRLLLVAPNVLHVERTLRVDPDDFRLWVCVHEQTHALQLAAAPWLADHLRAEVATLAAAMTSSGADDLRALRTGLARAVRAPRGRRRPGGDDGASLGVLGLVLDDEQRSLVARVSAVMALLEGHADVSMDAVPAAAIRSKRRLRSRFDARRRARGADAVLRRLLGLDAKLAQYRDGAAFVRAVRRTAGPAALDAAWASPQGLPSAAEIADPQAWVRRVHG